MQKIRNILVAVDFGEASMNALETAMIIGARHKADITIINVIDKSLDFVINAENAYVSDSSILNNAGNILNALANSLQMAHGIMPKVLLTEGFVFAEILKASLHLKSELIVMGTHGASGYRECFIGSNTYNVFKHSYCPVLTIPPQKKYKQFKKVLFPVRPVNGALARFDFLLSLIHSNSSLEVLGLSHRKNDDDKSMLEQLVKDAEEKISSDKMTTKAVYNGKQNVAQDVLETSLQLQSDLIVVSSTIDVTFKHFFVGPNTQRIINQAKVPVLSLRRLATPTFV
jgi:nucleotide-binding universal stress UspA family protein